MEIYKTKTPAEIDELLESRRPHTDFAEDLRISYSYLKYILKGRKTPGLALAVAMAEKLKVSVEDLVKWSESRVREYNKRKKK